MLFSFSVDDRRPCEGLERDRHDCGARDSLHTNATREELNH